MRLLSHNFLQSPLSSTPLLIVPTQVLHTPTPCNEEMVAKLVEGGRIDGKVLREAVEAVRPLLSKTPGAENLSEAALSALVDLTVPLPSKAAEALHSVLLDVHVQAGDLVDEVTGRKFRIENGIPNLILLEDEIGEGK